MDSKKVDFRSKIRSERSARQPSQEWQLLLQSPEIMSAQVIASYFSYGFEPDTTLLNGQLLAENKILLLPRMQSDRSLTWIQWRGQIDQLQREKKVLEPLGDEYFGPIDVVIIPALAVDINGHRLGQGGGSYDRALAKLNGWKVALVNDDEILDSPLPVEDHDQRVDAVVTPTRILRFK